MKDEYNRFSNNLDTKDRYLIKSLFETNSVEKQNIAEVWLTVKRLGIVLKPNWGLL